MASHAGGSAPPGFRAEVMRDVEAAARERGAGRAPETGLDGGRERRLERAIRVGAIAAGLLAVGAGAVAAAAGSLSSGELYVLVKSYPETLVEWLLVL